MKNLFYTFMVIMTVAAITSCKESVDPIHGTKPVDTSYWQGNVTNEFGDTVESTRDAYFPLEEFKALGEKNDTAAQRAMIEDEHNRRVLTTNIVALHPSIKDEKNIRFILGSGFARNIKSGDGKVYSGKFKNELIIILNDPSVKDTIFLACGNGMLSPIEDLVSSDFGNAEQWRFTIQEGEGLAHHLPALQAWAEIANNLSIPIKDKDGKVVSQETYLNYFGSYTTGLRTGDVIDVIAGKVYDKNGNEVNFNRRQQQTKRANKALKNKRR